MAFEPRTLILECRTRRCSDITGLTDTGDLQIYNLQDALLFNGVPLSLIAQCPTGYFCPPGVFPHVFTYPPGTFSVFQPPPNQPFPTVLSGTGCESLVTRIAPAGASAATIAALAASIIAELAAQQARCDAIFIAGPVLPRVISLSDVAATTCLNALFAATVTASASPSGAPYTMTLTNAPGWMTAVQNPAGTQLILGGTPAAFGVVTFTVTATASGYFGSKTYSLNVVGIATASPLPNATDGVAYSEVLDGSSLGAILTWSVITGALPGWLNLNSVTGALFGTPGPGDVAVSNFTIQVTNGTATCSKAFTLEVVAAAGCPFTDIAWDAPILIGIAAGSTGVGTFSVNVQPPAASPGFSQTTLNGSFVYTGPLYAATLRLNVIQFLTTSGFEADVIAIHNFVTSSVDGVLLSTGLLDPSFGIYDFAFNLPASVGAIITISIVATSMVIDPFLPGTGEIQLSGDFCP